MIWVYIFCWTIIIPIYMILISWNKKQSMIEDKRVLLIQSFIQMQNNTYSDFGWYWTVGSYVFPIFKLTTTN